MKRNHKLILFFSLILCLCLNLSAQERAIPERELTDIVNKAYELRRGKIYRETETREEYADYDLSPYFSIVTVEENLPPNRRSISVIKERENVTRQEIVYFNYERYIRTNDGDWREYQPMYGVTGGLGGDNYISREETLEYAYKGKDVIKNQDADFYESKMTVKYKRKEGDTVHIETTRYWFDTKGRFLKVVSLMLNTYRQEFNQTVREYEYDVDIKIEQPILKVEPKSVPKRVPKKRLMKKR